ncbi:MAG TPA: hypothetical protein VN579_04260 [Bryobacteraceae bacterium]|nr:hypothetical protein [Bryobacteraceae bacterium]
MNAKTVKAAIAEAHRFLEAAKAWERRIGDNGSIYWAASREGGAVKRASMDLTRALADMRKPS